MRTTAPFSQVAPGAAASVAPGADSSLACPLASAPCSDMGRPSPVAPDDALTTAMCLCVAHDARPDALTMDLMRLRSRNEVRIFLRHWLGAGNLESHRSLDMHSWQLRPDNVVLAVPYRGYLLAPRYEVNVRVVLPPVRRGLCLAAFTQQYMKAKGYDLETSEANAMETSEGVCRLNLVFADKHARYKARWRFLARVLLTGLGLDHDTVLRICFTVGGDIAL